MQFDDRRGVRLVPGRQSALAVEVGCRVARAPAPAPAEAVAIPALLAAVRPPRRLRAEALAGR